MSRINKVFEDLRKKGKKAFIPFIMAGDPNREIFRKIITQLPDVGADIIEVGIPFTDPMADGSIIQLSGKRALDNGQTLAKTLEDIAFFRKNHPSIPIILMGYYNPIYIYGVNKFLEKCKEIKIDGLIIVDLPPEEDSELCDPCHNSPTDFIRLVTPTTDKLRLKKLLNKASGFLYYVSIAGVTGSKSANLDDLKTKIKNIKSETDLPIGVGFGIKSKQDVIDISDAGADGTIIGSVIVDKIKDIKNDDDINDLMEFIRNLNPN